MSEAKSIVEQVAFDALSIGVSKAAVYQDAPEEATGPLVILGNLTSVRLPTKGGVDDRRVTLSIISMVQAEERAPLLAIQEEVETALDGQNFEHRGWTLAFEFEDDDAALTEDGATYAGVTQFAVLAIAP